MKTKKKIESVTKRLIKVIEGIEKDLVAWGDPASANAILSIIVGKLAHRITGERVSMDLLAMEALFIQEVDKVREREATK